MKIKCPFCQLDTEKYLSKTMDFVRYSCRNLSKDHYYCIEFSIKPYKLITYDLLGCGIDIYSFRGYADQETTLTKDGKIEKFFRPAGLDLESWKKLQAKADLLLRFH